MPHPESSFGMIGCSEPRRKEPVEIDFAHLGHHFERQLTQIARLESDVRLLGSKYQTAFASISNQLDRLEKHQAAVMSCVQAQSVQPPPVEAKLPDFDGLLRAHLQPLTKGLDIIREQTAQAPDANCVVGEEAGDLRVAAQTPRSHLLAAESRGGHKVFSARNKVEPSYAPKVSQPALPIVQVDYTALTDQLWSSRLRQDIEGDVKNTIHEEIQSILVEFKSMLCRGNLDLDLNEEKSSPTQENSQVARVSSQDSHAAFAHKLSSSTTPSEPIQFVQPSPCDTLPRHWSSESVGSKAADESPKWHVSSMADSYMEPSSTTSSPTSRAVRPAMFRKATDTELDCAYIGLDEIQDTAVARAFKAVAAGDTHHLRELLRNGMDPNSSVKSVVFGDKQYTNLSLFAGAVLVSNKHMVRSLVEAHASLESQYEFVAGSAKILWSGPAMYACAPKGNLAMLRLLVRLKADIHATSSSNANMVWQSAYFGHEEMLNYLLDQNVNCNIAACSQNHEDISFTPLHISIVNGKTALAEKLIEARADVNCQNELNACPLQAAICQCHPSTVQLLIAHGALLNISPPRPTSSTLRTQKAEAAGSCLQLLFEMNNPVLVHAAAVGLQDQEEQIQILDSSIVFEFLSNSSHSRCAILDAVFRKRVIHYRGAHLETIQRNTALVEKTDVLPGNRMYFHPTVVKETYSFQQVEQVFKKRQEPDDEMMAFINQLTPQSEGDLQNRSGERTLSSIATYECLLPGIHSDLRTMKAITDSSSTDDVFRHLNCQAIVHSCWDDVKLLAKVECGVHFMVLIVLLVIAESVHDHEKDGVDELVRWCATAGMALWFFTFLREFADALAHYKHGWLSEYLNPSNALDMFRLFADAALWGLIRFYGATIIDQFIFRAMFGAVCFLKWTKLLYCLTPFQFFGLKTMPILFAMRDNGPFCFIMVFYIAGLAHAFTAMGYDGAEFYSNFISAFFLGTIADFELSQEVIKPKNASMEETLFIQTLLVVITFLVPITLMNIFIAALSTSYECGVHNMDKLYQCRKAETCFGLLALQQTIKKMCSRGKWVRGQRRLWYSVECAWQGKHAIMDGQPH